MKYQYLFILLFIVNFSIKAQSYHTTIADTFYYPFEDNIQMIEIAFQKKEYMYANENNTYYYFNYFINGSTDNIYIFRDINGQIINVYNQKKQTIDFNKLRPISDSIYTEEFLLYQYIIGKYEDTISNKTIYFWNFKDDNNLQGIINQKGEIIVNAQYHRIRYYHKENIVLTRKYQKVGIIYLNNLDKNIEPIFDYFLSIPNSSWVLSALSYSPVIIDIETGKILFMSFNKEDKLSINRDENTNKQILTLKFSDNKKNIYTIKIDLETIYKKLIWSHLYIYRPPLPLD